MAVEPGDTGGRGGQQQDQPPSRGSRRQPNSVRALRRRICRGVQSGHVHRRAGRPGRALQPQRRVSGRGHRRRRAQAQPRLQSDARVRARQFAVVVHAGVRPAAGLRHRAAGHDRGGRRHRGGPIRGRRRGWGGHHLGCADRLWRRFASGVVVGAPVAVQRRAAQAARQVARVDRGGNSGEQGAAHRPVDGRSRRDHRQADGHQASRPGRAGRGQPSQHERGL